MEFFSKITLSFGSGIRGRPGAYMSAAWTLCRQKSAWNNPDRATTFTRLDVLFRDFCDRLYVDPRDRVYALLGLIRDGNGDASERLLANYTITPIRLYFQVLCYLRDAEALVFKQDWANFRTMLRIALGIHDRDSYNVIYQITEPYRPQKGLLFPKRVHYEFLNALRTKFTECFDHSNGDPHNTYNWIIFKLRGFPRQDDPQAWECFQNVLQEALDIHHVWT